MGLFDKENSGDSNRDCGACGDDSKSSNLSCGSDSEKVCDQASVDCIACSGDTSTCCEARIDDSRQTKKGYKRLGAIVLVGLVCCLGVYLSWTCLLQMNRDRHVNANANVNVNRNEEVNEGGKTDTAKNDRPGKDAINEAKEKNVNGVEKTIEDEMEEGEGELLNLLKVLPDILEEAEKAEEDAKEEANRISEMILRDELIRRMERSAGIYELMDLVDMERDIMYLRESLSSPFSSFFFPSPFLFSALSDYIPPQITLLSLSPSSTPSSSPSNSSSSSPSHLASQPPSPSNSSSATPSSNDASSPSASSLSSTQASSSSPSTLTSSSPSTVASSPSTSASSTSPSVPLSPSTQVSSSSVQASPSSPSSQTLSSSSVSPVSSPSNSPSTNSSPSSSSSSSTPSTSTSASTSTSTPHTPKLTFTPAKGSRWRVINRDSGKEKENRA